MWGSRSFLIAVSVLILATGACKPKAESRMEASITISVPYEVDSFDPQATITISNFAVLSNFYEPLVRTDASMKVQPCLARTWENPDALTWLFDLEPEVRFHNGQRLTSEDVQFSLNRLIHDPNMRMRAFLPDVTEVQPLTPTRIRIRTAHPVAVFLNKLNFALIIQKDSTAEMLAQDINGTGPYRMNGWKKGEFLRMVRNEDYWGKKPEIRDVMLRLGRTPDEAIQDIAQGKSNLAQSNTKKLETVVRAQGENDLLVHSSLFVKFLGFDLFREETPYCSVKPNPFRNILVRRAIHVALDRDELLSELSTQAVPATQPVPAFIFGFNPEIHSPVHNLQQARELMARAGLPDGFEVTLHTRNILLETATVIQKQLKPLGIKVNVVASPDEEFFPSMNRKDFSFFLTRWGCPSGDGSDILDDIFHSENGVEYGGNNAGGFSDPEVDQAIEEATEINTMEERRLAIQAIMAMLMEKLPMIPLYTDLDAYALNRRFDWQPRNDSYVLVREIGIRKKKQ